MHWLRGFLRSFAEQGHTVLLSSHALAEIAQTVDQIAIIDKGKIVRRAAIGEITADGRTLEGVYLDLVTQATS